MLLRVLGTVSENGRAALDAKKMDLGFCQIAVRIVM